MEADGAGKKGASNIQELVGYLSAELKAIVAAHELIDEARHASLYLALLHFLELHGIDRRRKAILDRKLKGIMSRINVRSLSELEYLMTGILLSFLATLTSQGVTLNAALAEAGSLLTLAASRYITYKLKSKDVEKVPLP